MNNSEKLAILGTQDQDKTKQKHNMFHKIYWWSLYVYTAHCIYNKETKVTV